ncbi:MAG TPA: type 2 isopentenyl-diphosphate Delta-isomerase [Bdellovibrionales bacterium]|nr:type 2 isopentenyl-diphosphate Delta-isomerase [Bdellovibrionales bacterium]
MEIIGEKPEQFESRKADHIRLALREETQALGGSGLDRIELIHDALPEIDFEDVKLEATCFGKPSATPLFISSMTAGHQGSINLNLTMAKVAQARQWAMGVGSQRRQLTDRSVDTEWKVIRRECPDVRLFGNIGISQAIQTTTDDLRRLVDTLEAEALIIHLNPLQECLQPEGTPRFKGGLAAITRVARELKSPVIIKETGCGISRETFERLRGSGVAVVDVSGYGGTHWGRIEGGRAKPSDIRKGAAETFKEWGISTVESLLEGLSVEADYEIWASGGVRSGLDAAKLLAMGAKQVGLAKPVIEAALQGEDVLNQAMERIEFELKCAMFCSGVESIERLQTQGKRWRAVK